MTNQPVIEALKKLLADSYSLYLKTQNYHWNVEGPMFFSLHTLFEQQYTDLALAIDEVAERIRALGAKAPGTMKAYGEISSIKPGNEDATAEQMAKELAKDQDTLRASLYAVLEAAQKAQDEASVDLAVGRIQIHEKNAWMLRSIAK